MHSSTFPWESSASLTQPTVIAASANASNRPLSDSERFQYAFENATVGMFQTTFEGKYLRVNRAMARLLGYDSPEALMDAVSDVGRQVYVDPQRREEFIRAVTANGAIMNFEIEVFVRGGRPTWILVNAWAVRNADGQILYFEGFFEKMIQRKRGERNFQRQTPVEICGQIRANVDREICLALEELTGLLDRLGNTPLSPQQHRYVREARVAADSLAALFDGALAGQGVAANA